MNTLESKSAACDLNEAPVSLGNFSKWLFVFLGLAVVSFLVGALAMWSSIYGQTQNLLPSNVNVQSRAARTDVSITDGINGGAGPGSTAVKAP
ncbi:MAG: hypothetical protein WCT03_07785 [Candidatus Obscuribacterales bacterium]|jgi:hypothetical protein